MFVIRGKVTSPFSLPSQRIWPANETSYDRASVTCVCEYTYFCTQVLYFFCYFDNRSAVGEKTNELGYLTSLVFPQRDFSVSNGVSLTSK